MITVIIDSKQVLTKGLRIEDVLTQQPNTATFILRDPAAEPLPGQTVTIYRDSVENILFGGVIVTVEKSHPAPGSTDYQIECMDWQRLLDRELVFEVYENKTCKEIIEHMVANYTDALLGFSTANVQDGPFITKVVFNYQFVCQCIRELAELVGYDWYVDEDRDIHFFEQESAAAPFVIDDNSLAVKVDSYRIAPDYSQVRNRVFVRGGYTLSDPYTESQAAGAVQTVFKLGYKPHGLSMTVNGVPKTIGIEFLDEETAYDYMMNYQESTVRTSSITNPPGAGALMAFTYTYEVPVIVLVQDHGSQSAIASLEGGSGVYEHIVVDSTIGSKIEAYNRAQAEIEQFANPWVSGSFTTYEHGFWAGQTVTIGVTGERYNGKYRIRNVDMTLVANNIIKYTVSYSTTLYDLVDLLEGLVKNQRRVKLREDEVVDRLEYVNETVSVTDGIVIDFMDHPSKWGSRKWGGFTWG